METARGAKVRRPKLRSRDIFRKACVKMMMRHHIEAIPYTLQMGLSAETWPRWSGPCTLSCDFLGPAYDVESFRRFEVGKKHKSRLVLQYNQRRFFCRDSRPIFTLASAEVSAEACRVVYELRVFLRLLPWTTHPRPLAHAGLSSSPPNPYAHLDSHHRLPTSISKLSLDQQFSFAHTCASVR
jgi:hypothetical protein